MEGSWLEVANLRGKGLAKPFPQEGKTLMGEEK